MIRRVAVLALGAGLVLGACTESADTLDATATEEAVGRVVEPRLGAEVDEVRCPSPIRRADGETVTCRVVLAEEAGVARVSVTQRGSGEQVDVDLLDAVVDPAEVGRQLHQALVAEYGRSFTVDCGADGVRVAEPGETFACSAVDEVGRRKVSATVVDAAGTLSFDLSGAGA